MLNFLNQFDPSVTVTIQLLKNLNVKVTDFSVKETIERHPDFPSILSISDSLNSWHVDNKVIKINPIQIINLPCPFIAYTKANGGTFVVVKDIKDDNIFYLNPENQTKVKRVEEFLQQFNDVVLLAQTNKHSGEKDYKIAFRKRKLKQLQNITLIIIGILILSAWVITNFQVNEEKSASIIFSFLIFLKLFGTLVACLLIWYEIDKTNPTLQRFCTYGGKTNCNAILNSKASKIFGVSWSEIGFFYFAGGFLFLILTEYQMSAINLSFIRLFNLCALPYIFFSVFYQWFIAKQWCPLCLTIQVVLFLEFTVFTLSPLKFNFESLFPVLPALFISFALPIIIWIIIKPILYKQQQAKQDLRTFQKIKFDPDIFNMLLKKQKYLNNSADGLGIILGNKNAPNTLLKVCNPYCRPCAKAHPEIDKLLEENKNLKVQIIFYSPVRKDDSKYLIVNHFLAIDKKNDSNLTKKALNEWYLSKNKSYEIFTEKFPLNGELIKQKNMIIMMNEWFKKEEILGTPTFFLNNYQLPSEYSITDLHYFLAGQA